MLSVGRTALGNMSFCTGRAHLLLACVLLPFVALLVLHHSCAADPCGSATNGFLQAINSTSVGGDLDISAENVDVAYCEAICVSQCDCLGFYFNDVSSRCTFKTAVSALSYDPNGDFYTKVGSPPPPQTPVSVSGSLDR